ncbi:stage V sporulation protein E [Vulcanimicrobium alpinum]|uniref:Probable peptidoglycan glycosyltransferase FtsW n=1 Tax=Vulcanimicrobium alpinum TaxID=3016050 RepID=A0AAN1XZS1_UNVUL|nr:putative lipid II flippase FtsW [Vulcanimicrobium alpinum]BDE07930.1 stage V sporulation protein E [Vulcanimicrobium alpinum]
MLGSASVAPRARGRERERGRERTLRIALRPPDALLLGAAAFLVAIGLVMVFSASSVTAYASYHDNAFYLKRQLAYLGAGIVFGYLAYRIDYRKLRALAPGTVILAVVLLVLTLIPHVGFATGGARRWLGFHALSFQPSEFAKLALVLFLAAKLAQLGEGVLSLSKGVAPAFFVTFLLAVPIFLEPDMGTASLLIFTAFAMIFVAGARFEHLVMVTLALLPAVAVAVGSSAYKRARVFAFLNPWKDAQNTGFHIVQSLLALGSGGVIGLGLGASRQKYFYLPEAHTDFIFAVLGEELGLLGGLVVIALFVLFAVRAITLAQKAPDRFGMMLALGCTFLIVIQAFINIGVVTGSWPVTGVPLPFISFGGTSLVVSLVAVGLIANVGRCRALP